jgi:DNA polymerase-3 subunit delta
MGFFGNQKVTWFKDVTFLTDNRTGKSESVKTKLGELTALIKKGLEAGQILIITSPKVDKRYAFYKACKAAGDVSEFSVPDKAYLAEKQAAERLRELVSMSGLKMPQSVMTVFGERVGFDTRRMANEIEKLSIYLGDRKDVKVADIEAVTSSSQSALAWDLADAVGKRKLGRALEILRQLIFQKENTIGLIITIENRIKDLAFYREALDRKWLMMKKGYRGNTLEWSNLPPAVDEVLGSMKKDPRQIHPYRAGLLAAQAGLFSREELTRCRKTAIQAHEKLVSSSVPAQTVLELMLIRMLA